MPCTDLLLYISLLPGLKICDKIGPRGCIIVSLLCQYVSYALLVFVPNYYVVLFSMCLFGVGSGLCQLVYQKNCWKYFPERKGLVNGIILGGCGISASILTLIADFIIINPEKKTTDKQGLYPEYIAKRLINYLYLLCGYFILLGILATVFTFKYEEEEKEGEIGRETEGEIKGLDSKLIKDDEEGGNSNNNNTPTPTEEKVKESENISSNNNNNSEQRSKIFKDAFFSRKNFQMMSFCFCGFCKS